MQIVDELVTPGCPQCAVKHLSAALSYVADMDPATRYDLRDKQEGAYVYAADILLARALINIAESAVGYRSHIPFAVGLLERAERTRILDSGLADPKTLAIRNLRLALQSGRPWEEALDGLQAMGTLAYVWAHIIEAQRELPDLRVVKAEACDLQDAIGEVRDKYFSVSMPDAVQEETTPREEPEMAIKKKPACKGTKCACKGGKTKKK